MTRSVGLRIFFLPLALELFSFADEDDFSELLEFIELVDSGLTLDLFGVGVSFSFVFEL